jgi:hypothetical protein
MDAGFVISGEPLLAIGRQLIGWSLGIGMVAVVILVAINHFVPIAV